MILDMRGTHHAVKCYLCVILCLLLWQNGCLCINYSYICVNAVDHCDLSVVLVILNLRLCRSRIQHHCLALEAMHQYYKARSLTLEL